MLNPDEKAIFNAARQIDEPDARRVYLEQACGGNRALHGRIEALLRVHIGDQDFLRSPALTASNPLDESIGSRIGPYQLLEQLGEGGFGVVFLAEQQSPVRRKVALKVIKPGMDTRQVVARFEVERQALALMDHPNIARVLDAGATAAGRPYFVMELVRGMAVTEFCDQQKLSVRQRLELFVGICQAVQHAHQKGIIHRDLKPSNVLVAPHDNAPAVKVIDFGIAKALDQTLTEKTLATGTHQIVGTPLYMSPEQADTRGGDIDTRTDIYALGVLLYELLTGTTPFERERLKTASFDEVRRIIREEEPARPSDRLSTIGAAAETVSTNRHSDPKRLSRLVRGELDWIVMKALEKDRNRRYETANGLAQDISRFLNDEPVLARPPSARYRLRKFVKRNRGPLLAATVVLLALVGGGVSATMGLFEARRQRNQTEDARREEAEQRRIADANANAANLLKDQALKLAHDEKSARNRAEWLLYASRISLVKQAWEHGNINAALQYLGSCRRDFRGWEYDYLDNQMQSIPHQSLRGHPDAVACVAISGDSKRIVSGSRDGTIMLWDAAAGKSTLTFKARLARIVRIALSADGKRIISGHSDPTGEWIVVWDAADGNELKAIKGDESSILGMELTPDGERVITGSDNGRVKVWDLKKGAIISSFQAETTLNGVFGDHVSVALSADGKRITTGAARNRSIRIWEMNSGKEIAAFADTAEIACVAMFPDGKRIVSGTNTGILRVWDVDTGQVVHTLKGHADRITCVTASRDGKRIFSGSADSTVRIWDSATGQELRSLKGHTSHVLAIAVSLDNQRIVSGSSDCTVKVWRVNEEALTLRPPSGSDFDLIAQSPDKSRVVTSARNAATGDCVLQIWDGETGRLVGSIPVDKQGIHRLAFDPGGHSFCAIEGQSVKIWNALNGDVIESFKRHTDSVLGAAVRANPRRIIHLCGNGRVKSWDGTGEWDTRMLQGYLPRHPDNKHHEMSLILTDDGRHVFGGRTDGTLRLWDVETGRLVQTLKGHPPPAAIKGYDLGVTAAALSHDRKRIVSGGTDGLVKLWDAATGDELLSLAGHRTHVALVALLPDGKRIISGSNDRTVKIWDAATGFETLSLLGNIIAISADGKRILYQDVDGTLKAWDAKSK